MFSCINLQLLNTEITMYDYFLSIALSPNISVMAISSYDGAFAVGTTGTLYCNISIDTVVKSVTVVWSRNGGSPLVNNTNYTISSLMIVSGTYIASSLTIKNFMPDDNGASYTCASYIEHYYSNNVSSSDTIYLTIACELVKHLLLIYDTYL